MNVMTITDVYNITSHYPDGILHLQEGTLLNFQGGSITNGTIQGNNVMINAAPYQIFTDSVQFNCTWKVDKVYPEYFGLIQHGFDPNNSANNHDCSAIINKALSFSNLTGCVVQLLPKDYYIEHKLVIKGGNTLQGTIFNSSQSGDSALSKHGTTIIATMNSTDPLISIVTDSNTQNSTVDCYRFSLNNLTIRNTGTSTAIDIKSIATLTPRSGHIENLKITETEGYAIDISGSSYIRIEMISITGGKGIRLTGTKLQEFIWMHQIAIGALPPSVTGYTLEQWHKNPYIEINNGNNIYLSEIDTNDSYYGLLVTNPKESDTPMKVFNLFVQRFNSARCTYPIRLYSDSDWITRLKMSEITISGNTTSTFKTIAAISIDKAIRSSIPSFGFTECIFDNVNIDNMPSDAFSIMENNDSMKNGIFTNVRTSSPFQLGESSKFELSNIQTGGYLRANGGSISYTKVLTTNSIFNKHPIVVVSTNQKIPFSVTTTNTRGGTCSFIVTFSSKPSTTVFIYYHLTGYFYIPNN